MRVDERVQPTSANRMGFHSLDVCWTGTLIHISIRASVAKFDINSLRRDLEGRDARIAIEISIRSHCSLFLWSDDVDTGWRQRIKPEMREISGRKSGKTPGEHSPECFRDSKEQCLAGTGDALCSPGSELVGLLPALLLPDGHHRLTSGDERNGDGE
ncbi:MAG TPA: hypothetical protein VGM77_12825 [Gemmatimonadales bacterium]|jgi:hypothetical protein